MRFLPKSMYQLAFSLLLIPLMLLVISPSVIAADKDVPQSTAEDTNAETLTTLSLARLVLLEAANSIACQLRGIEPKNYTVDCLGLPDSQQAVTQSAAPPPEYTSGGALLFTENAINTLYTPPANTGAYVRDLASNFGVAKRTHAQDVVDCTANPGDPACTGVGFQSISQIQYMWELSLNITYLLLVIVFVIVGIAIMLRVHIDPRTVMTIQNQIPKAIAAIILITFSYAIVGFMIDVMWVGTYVGINTVTSRQQNCDPDDNGHPENNLPLSGAATIGILNNPIAFTTDIFGDKTGCFGRFDGISGLARTVGSTFADIISRGFIGLVGLDEEVACNGLTSGDFDIGNCAKAAVFELFKIVASILGFLFVFFALLIALLRVWVTLLKAYIYLIIDIIFAPFWILLSILPGSSMSFMLWGRNVIAQLAIFPTTAILLVMASVVAQDETLNNQGAQAFLPPLIGNPNIPDNLGALTAFGFILLAPEVANIVRDALKAPPSKYGQSVTQGASKGNPMGAVAFVGTLGYQISGAKNVPLVNRLPFLKDKPGPGTAGGGGGGGGTHRTT